MSGADSLMIVHLLEDHEPGHRFVRNSHQWPLHITLVPWFYIESFNLPHLDEALANLSKTKQPFDIKVGTQVMLRSGEGGLLPVNIVAEQRDIKQLHLELLGLVRSKYKAFHLSPPKFIEGDYIAHITHNAETEGSPKHKEGDVFSGGFSLIREISDGGISICELVKNFDLGASS